MKVILITLTFVTFQLYSQSDFDKVLKTGEILVNGLSFFKGGKQSTSNSKIITSICVKNKLADKITFQIVGIDEDDNDIKKELVIQKDGKECFLELPKGIYTYQIILSNKDIFKKGDYKFDDDTTITVKID